VGYTGSEGHTCFDKYTVNLINPLTGTRPLAGFGSFGLKANDGNDNFNALQASAPPVHARAVVPDELHVFARHCRRIIAPANPSVSRNGLPRLRPQQHHIDGAAHDDRHAVYDLPFGHGKQFLQDGTASASSAAGSLPPSPAPRPVCRSTSR